MNCIICGKEIIIKKNNHIVSKTKCCSRKCNSRAYYLADKELVNRNARIWHKNNLEKVKEISHKYNQNHKEIVKERHNKWRKRNPDKVREYERKAHNKYRHNSEKRRIRGNIRCRTWREVPIPFGEKCHDCKIENAVARHHEDYSKPLEVVFLCEPCHDKRHEVTKNV